MVGIKRSINKIIPYMWTPSRSLRKSSNIKMKLKRNSKITAHYYLHKVKKRNRRILKKKSKITSNVFFSQQLLLNTFNITQNINLFSV